MAKKDKKTLLENAQNMNVSSLDEKVLKQDSKEKTTMGL